MRHCSTKWAVSQLSLKSLLEAGKGVRRLGDATAGP
jgi:hypothetical protein